MWVPRYTKLARFLFLFELNPYKCYTPNIAADISVASFNIRGISCSSSSTKYQSLFAFRQIFQAPLFTGGRLINLYSTSNTVAVN